ncbi:hypothetical protein GAO43_15375 [Bacteroides thetaiotaomicron]|uniref:Uncharacterized protein n=1 Tax=Bacteroides thetaiotaomicron TaxID=818 RepID=A0A6I0MZU5_BACT4|nr:hypothetical protein GAO47_22175 [Bacteroides thetaiotaomicron]MSL31353.1 hypothetical protein [Escherichia coli]KAB4273828.1 hypothetical protein GAO45_26535 [Bacteroides thetaiotaomicron]KAB4275153.1 hypothetical protein GAO40_05590 [Bacteroides thetaiotaomicron]KAB4278995.1 hypothetical protein GAO35_13555 [Bacteroides thetaiotaomicron]
MFAIIYVCTKSVVNICIFCNSQREFLKYIVCQPYETFLKGIPCLISRTLVPSISGLVLKCF